MTATCDRLHCLLLGWEHSPESISLEGGRGDASSASRSSASSSSAVGWVLLETGMDPGTCADPDTGGAIYTFGARRFETADPFPTPCARTGSASRTSRWPRSATCTSTTPAGCGTSRAWCPSLSSGASCEFATSRAGIPEAYVRGDYDLPALEWSWLDGDAELTPGIDVLSTPGHTPGHMSYRVNMADSGPWLFAVDAIDLQQGIDDNVAIGWSADPADAPRRRDCTTDWWRWPAPRGRGWSRPLPGGVAVAGRRSRGVRCSRDADWSVPSGSWLRWAEMTAVILAESLTKRFGSITAVEDLSFELEPAQ